MANYTGSNRRFGVTSDVEGLKQGIIVNNISHSDSTETAEARNEKGQLIDLAVYGGGDEISVDGLVVGDGVKAGTVVTIGGKNYLVTTTSKTESNTAFQTANFNARYAEDCYYWPMSAVLSGVPDENTGYVSGTINSDDSSYGS